MPKSQKNHVFQILTENQLTIPEIAYELKLGPKAAGVYVHRLKKEGKVEHTGEKKGRAKIYHALNLMENDDYVLPDKILEEKKELLEMLHFLNEFFKENVAHLNKSKKIAEFVEEKSDMFDKIQKTIDDGGLNV
ncbi:MAG: hypothetical protein ACFFCS_25795 [Candidatus Hodarchaeota archaeon]